MNKLQATKTVGRTAMLVIVCATLVGACSMGRVSEIRQQFCDVDSNFSWSTGPQPYFTFENPVLLASDVDTLIGYSPAHYIDEGDSTVHRYVIEQFTLDDSPGRRYTLDLRYREREGETRLSTIHLPADLGFSEELQLAEDPEAIAEAADRICNTSMRPRLRLGPMEETIPAQRLADLPDREKMLAMMGEPSWESPQENALVYEYRFLGEQDNDDPIRMVVWFDEGDTRPLRMETRYRFMRSQADFELGRIRYSYDF